MNTPESKACGYAAERFGVAKEKSGENGRNFSGLKCEGVALACGYFQDNRIDVQVSNFNKLLQSYLKGSTIQGLGLVLP